MQSFRQIFSVYNLSPQGYFDPKYKNYYEKSMIIRSANSTDLDAIRHLWQDCFFDPIEYIDFYIKNRFEAKYCAILEIDGEVVGMIHLLPCTIYHEEKSLYWYAAGSRSDKRNQGLFIKFAKAVKEKAERRWHDDQNSPV